MVRFLINAAFCGAALITRKLLLEGGAFSGLSVDGAVLIRRGR